MPADNLRSRLHRWALLHAAHWGFAPSDRLYLLRSCPGRRQGIRLYVHEFKRTQLGRAHDNITATAELWKHGKMDRQIPRMVKNCVIRARRWKLFRRLFKYGCTWEFLFTNKQIIVWERKPWQYRLSLTGEKNRSTCSEKGKQHTVPWGVQWWRWRS